MSPEEQKRFQEMEGIINSLFTAASFPFDVEKALRIRLKDLSSVYPSGLLNAPLGAITAPTGGATIDSQARTTITTIISRLQTLGLTS